MASTRGELITLTVPKRSRAVIVETRSKSWKSRVALKMSPAVARSLLIVTPAAPSTLGSLKACCMPSWKSSFRITSSTSTSIST